MLELKGTDTQAFDDAVEELAKVVNHHLTEEELTILNPAREEVGDRLRGRAGREVRHRAQPRRSTTAAAPHPVRRLVAAARREGLLDDDDEEDESEAG